MKCKRRRAYMSIRKIFVFAIASTSTLIIFTCLTSWPPAFDANYPANGQIKSPPPGAFLRQNNPNNESYCFFKYGLPEELVFEDDDLEYSPELGSASPYKVLYNVIKGRSDFNHSVPVTYATHVTADFINYVAEIARSWEGPISVAAFVPDADAEIVGKQLLHLCYCLQDMSKVSVHFVFPANETPYYLSMSAGAPDPVDCVIADITKQESYRILKNLIYPVNVCRNVAKLAATTHFILVSDVQLIPSDKLASKFIKMVDMYTKSGKHLRKMFLYITAKFTSNVKEN